jgi:hypothetical protein
VRREEGVDHFQWAKLFVTIHNHSYFNHFCEFIGRRLFKCVFGLICFNLVKDFRLPRRFANLPSVVFEISVSRAADKGQSLDGAETRGRAARAPAAGTVFVQHNVKLPQTWEM